jgi:leader peptidase (prepilin peptidase)/N-methyltransferase
MMIDILLGVIILSFMGYAAIWDAKKRIIPNLVPIMLLALGIAAVFLPKDSYWYVPLLSRVAGFALPTITLLVLHFLKKPVGGGDFKLSAALGFLLGLHYFAVAYLIGGMAALVWAKVKKQKSVPLAVFLMIGVVVCLLL